MKVSEWEAAHKWDRDTETYTYVISLSEWPLWAYLVFEVLDGLGGLSRHHLCCRGYVRYRLFNKVTFALLDRRKYLAELPVSRELAIELNPRIQEWENDDD